MYAIFFITGFLLLYIRGSFYQAIIINTKMEDVDQGAYLRESSNINNYNDFIQTDRNRMPLYKLILRLFMPKNINDFFLRAKILNINLSIIYLLILFLIFKKYLPLLASITLCTYTAFTLFMFRSPYVGAELTFYFFFFLSFILICRLLEKPNISISLIAGLVVAFSYFSKASGLILFYTSAIVFLIKIIYLIIKRNLYLLIKNFTYYLCFILAFLLVSFPYLQYNKKVFNSYFYNANTRFYLWYDSWEQVKNDPRINPSYSAIYTHLPSNLNINELPSFSNYLKSHTMEQIKKRFYVGLLVYIDLIKGIKANTNYHYQSIFFLLIISTFIFSILKIKTALGLLKKYLFSFIFFILIISIYFVGICWYYPIARGNRFLMNLFLPISFSLLWFGNKLLEKGSIIKKFKIKSLFYWSLFIFTILISWQNATFYITKIYEGN